MAIKESYLKQLSDLFVSDLLRSRYYKDLPLERQVELREQIESERDRGQNPLVPGATDTEIQNLAQAVENELHISLPNSVREIIRQIDGFVENGVTLYGVDFEYREDDFDAVPGLLAQNLAIWSNFAESFIRYLLLGDSELWYFGIDIESGRPVALDNSNLEPRHYFRSVDEMVNDMLQQALGDFEEGDEKTSEFQFSRN